ncbi:MAG: hypothetical protein LAO79_21380 [Acidobacteriia bacterium]|nr:hypothetical protein [Terriglobia bacterium]
MNIRFLYHAEAVAATGKITLPFQETMPIQASAALPINGGHGSARAEKFRHRNIFSFECAESNVVGSYSELDKAHGTLSYVVVEGLNILDVVTCDRMVVRLTSKHSDDRSEASFIILGSRFENLRIAGHPFDVDLATDTFSSLSTWSRLTESYGKEARVQGEIDRLIMAPNEGGGFKSPSGVLGVTLARNLDNLPPGLTRRDHGIYVPHFGTVYLGEYFISPTARRLLMLHVDLGCSIEGCYGVGSSGGNGSTWP